MRLAEHDAVRVLVSFGLAGGLDPELAPGALVIADTVLDPDGQCSPCDPTWNATLRQAVASPDTVGGTLLTSDSPLATPRAKARVHASPHHPIAVDMESSAIAAVAKRRQLPFVTLRVVADAADTSLPASALAALDADGRFRLLTFVSALLRHPGDLFRLPRLATSSRRAHRTLRAAATTLDRLARTHTV